MHPLPSYMVVPKAKIPLVNTLVSYAMKYCIMICSSSIFSFHRYRKVTNTVINMLDIKLQINMKSHKINLYQSVLFKYKVHAVEYTSLTYCSLKQSYLENL